MGNSWLFEELFSIEWTRSLRKRIDLEEREVSLLPRPNGGSSSFSLWCWNRYKRGADFQQFTSQIRKMLSNILRGDGFLQLYVCFLIAEYILVYTTM